MVLLNLAHVVALLPEDVPKDSMAGPRVTVRTTDGSALTVQGTIWDFQTRAALCESPTAALAEPSVDRERAKALNAIAATANALNPDCPPAEWALENYRDKLWDALAILAPDVSEWPITVREGAP